MSATVQVSPNFADKTGNPVADVALKLLQASAPQALNRRWYLDDGEINEKTVLPQHIRDLLDWDSLGAGITSYRSGVVFRTVVDSTLSSEQVMLVVKARRGEIYAFQSVGLNEQAGRYRVRFDRIGERQSDVLRGHGSRLFTDPFGTPNGPEVDGYGIASIDRSAQRPEEKASWPSFATLRFRRPDPMLITTEC